MVRITMTATMLSNDDIGDDYEDLTINVYDD